MYRELRKRGAGRSRAGGAAFAEPADAERAVAKINLTLRVAGKRADGYHDLDSLVCFASVGDRLAFRPSARLELRVRGPAAADAGPLGDNLVLKAARALAERIEGLKLGRFGLIKRLPAGAGFGGGSADAAAALRLLARANNLDLTDDRVVAAARAAGADVPVCVDPKPRWMRGVGDVLSEPLALPRLPAVLVHPHVALKTKDVFAALGRSAGLPQPMGPPPLVPLDRKALAGWLSQQVNDLEPAAIRLAPIVADVLSTLHEQPGCVLARMSGSGSGCFGLFASRSAALLAARTLVQQRPAWWVAATVLGGPA